MTKPYSFQVVGGISVLRFSRSPTLNEILGAMEVLSEGGAARRRLWVLEGGASLDRAELAAIAQRAINIWPVPSRSAIVAPNDLTFGLARMLEVFQERQGLEVCVFRREQEAVEWLNEGEPLQVR